MNKSDLMNPTRALIDEARESTNPPQDLLDLADELEAACDKHDD